MYASWYNLLGNTPARVVSQLLGVPGHRPILAELARKEGLFETNLTCLTISTNSWPRAKSDKVCASLWHSCFLWKYHQYIGFENLCSFFFWLSLLKNQIWSFGNRELRSVINFLIKPSYRNKDDTLRNSGM